MDERPLGWYRDPENARAHRYWNGQGWMVTETVQGQAEDESDSE